MDRPTAGDVEWFLTMHNGQDCTLTNAECVLAAEVRALREDVLSWRRSAGERQAIVERVEALPAKWMDYAVFDTGNVADCARDLEEALRQP